jgi:hypothetical protein
VLAEQLPEVGHQGLWIKFQGFGQAAELGDGKGLFRPAPPVASFQGFDLVWAHMQPLGQRR